MKPLLLICFLLTGLFSRAQFKLPSAPFNFSKGIAIKPMNAFSFPKATLSSTNTLGRIYILPVDKIPCLVPDASLIISIPNARMPFTNSLMLNPYTKEALIPAQ